MVRNDDMPVLMQDGITLLADARRPAEPHHAVPVHDRDVQRPHHCVVAEQVA